MSLISNVGRRSLQVRLLVAVMYCILTAGAVTMVYPFLIMLSGSLKTNVDVHDYDVLPAFIRDDTVLFRKYAECKYNNSAALYRTVGRNSVYDFSTLLPPATVVEQRAADWREFEASTSIPPGWYYLGWMSHTGDRLELPKQREFRKHLMDLCGRDLRTLRERFGDEAGSWLAVGSFVERVSERRYQLAGSALEEEFYRFKSAQPPGFRIYPSIDGAFATTILQPTYGADIAAVNAAHGTAWASLDSVVLPRTAPQQPAWRRDWERFVRQELNLQFIRIAPEAQPLFGRFLEDRYGGRLDLLNRRYGTGVTSFAGVTFPDERLRASARLADLAAFVKTVPLEHLSIVTPETEFRDFLRRKYGSPAALNSAHRAEYASFETVPMPVSDIDHADFVAQRSELRVEFLTANYRQVIDYIVLHGRSLWNTLLYCVLGVILALTVNPLAAYALSRFRMPGAYRILLFCMCTMAFPPAVSMIPSFLLIKQLGLLNTFAALLLPVMANGFNIFLLKGFFDSLPRELYESAQLDGAGEWVMFWNLTMALSKPILAVLALGAFNAAYGNFMFAFLLCPDESMWTLMVFLYQLQIKGHMGLTFAALLLAAIPTFVVFVLCQKLIIRGIVVPVEK